MDGYDPLAPVPRYRQIANIIRRRIESGELQPERPIPSEAQIMQEFGVSQLAVVQAEPPLAEAEVIGAVHERDLMQRAFKDPALLDRSVREVMSAPLPTVGSGESLELAVHRLEEAPAVLVIDHGHPVGVLTRTDALGFLAEAGRMTEAGR